MAEKNVTGFVKLQIPAGAANPAPPVGPALGAQGVNIMQFCQASTKIRPLISYARPLRLHS